MDKKKKIRTEEWVNDRIVIFLWIVLFGRQDDKPCAAAIEKYLKRKKYFNIKEEKKGKGAICKFSYFKTSLAESPGIGINDKRLLCLVFSPHEGQLQTSITFRESHTVTSKALLNATHSISTQPFTTHLSGLNKLTNSMKGRRFPEFPAVNKSCGGQEKMPKTKTTAPFTSLITSVRRQFGPSLMKCKIVSQHVSHKCFSRSA